MMKQKPGGGFGFGGETSGQKLKSPKLPDPPSAQGTLTKLTSVLSKSGEATFVDENDMVEVCGFCNQTRCDCTGAPRKLVPRSQAFD